MSEEISPRINELNSLNEQFFFLGTMHIAQSSSEAVQKTIEELDLDCVMIELDQMRYQSLIDASQNVESNPSILEGKNISDSNNSHKKKDFMESLKEMQESIGKLLGITPGIEMISAIETVKKLQIPLRFIDRPILDTFQRMQDIQEDVQKEQEDLLESLEENSIDSNSSEIQDLMEEMQKPGFLAELIEDFKKNYPNIATVLLTERNEYMVDQIMEYYQNHPNHRILIVTGAGHTQEMFLMVQKNLPVKP
ncbi:TraB domain-containing protein [Candidatus Lokiarchaeum ossiferum]|uniref:TraB domain-containing protein n=1 Tax=Candidatus Lokiarchaeum ossiferum TaxID=2951803 RepID=UPI00352E2CF5